MPNPVWFLIVAVAAVGLAMSNAAAETLHAAPLPAHLRETGESKGYNASFTRKDRSQFLQALEQAVQAAKRGS